MPTPHTQELGRPGLADYGFSPREITSLLFPYFSLAFPICARYFTQNPVPLGNSFRINCLGTRTIGMELAWSYTTLLPGKGAKMNRLPRALFKPMACYSVGRTASSWQSSAKLKVQPPQLGPVTQSRRGQR